MKNYHRKKTGYTGPITKICILCGKEYSTPQYHQKYCGKKCRTKIENRNKQKGSRKELKWIPVYENPFHPTEKIHEHHIDNNHIVVLPADIHLCYAGCHTRNDNDDLDYIIKQIYPTFERSEFRT